MPAILPIVKRVTACLGATAMLALAGAALTPAAAQMDFAPAQDEASLLGGARAQGAVIWSHGRSVDSEDSRAPTPAYMFALRRAGWDIFRLNRMRVVDTLPTSGAALAGEAEALKLMGYRRVVLTGQSFGAFISIIAAGKSDAVDAVIATAPAAFGSVESNPDSYGLNASRLYDLLGAVRRARVALFFFAGDIFDPGGRGPVADRILAAHQVPHLIVDRPEGLSTHWASVEPGFTSRFSACLTAFADSDAASGTLNCRSLTAGALQVAGLR